MVDFRPNFNKRVMSFTSSAQSITFHGFNANVRVYADGIRVTPKLQDGDTRIEFDESRLRLIAVEDLHAEDLLSIWRGARERSPDGFIWVDSFRDSNAHIKHRPAADKAKARRRAKTKAAHRARMAQRRKHD